MRSLFVYHAVTLPPIVVIVYFCAYHHIGVLFFVLLMSIYALIFRPILDFYRLRALNLIDDGGFWTIFGPARFRHYRKLMFGEK